MLWSPPGPLLLLFLRPPGLGSPDPHPSAPTQGGEGGFWNLTEGPVLVTVDVPPARVAHQAACVLDCL